MRYPDIKFDGYRLRFGVVTAQFINAAWQHMAGMCGPVRTKEPPTLYFLTKQQVLDEILSRKERNLNYYNVADCLVNWPNASQLRNHPKWPERSKLLLRK